MPLGRHSRARVNKAHGKNLFVPGRQSAVNTQRGSLLLPFTPGGEYVDSLTENLDITARCVHPSRTRCLPTSSSCRECEPKQHPAQAVSEIVSLRLFNTILLGRISNKLVLMKVLTEYGMGLKTTSLQWAWSVQGEASLSGCPTLVSGGHLLLYGPSHCKDR